MRIKTIQEILAEKNLDALLVASDSNRQYLSGFSGSSGALVVTRTDSYLITDSRYTTQATTQTEPFGVEVIQHNGPMVLDIELVLQKHGVKTLGFEAEHVDYATYLAWSEKFSAELIATTELVERVRMIKDAEELKLMDKAVEIIEDTYLHVLDFAKAGMRELDVALEAEFFMRKLGASGTSFDTIVASGWRGSLPHGAASDKVIEDGDLVTLDFGAVYQSYCSDMTRTFAVGTPRSEKLVDIYNIVLKSQLAGCDAVAQGLSGAAVDKVVRDIIADVGYGEYFGHGTGHAVGMDVHENPRVSPAGETILEPGMVVTIEPGIYIPELGGVRIEDMILVTADGNRNMMKKAPKDLRII